MPEDARLFLTHAQALAAIRADLRHYAPQKALFRDLSRILLGKHTVADAGDESGLWIETGKPGKMRKITWSALCDRLCAAAEALPPDLSTTADILARVYAAEATVGPDAGGRGQGVWLETGMADFACRLCGKCCRSLDYHDQCSVGDVHRWRLAGRNDLIARARPVYRAGRIDHYRIWTSADGMRTRRSCPWLQPAGGDRFICSIQSHKPQICRQYPGSRKHALMTGCRGFTATAPVSGSCSRPPSCHKAR